MHIRSVARAAVRVGRQVLARRALAPMVVGPWCIVEGRPVITATDARAGHSFIVLSRERTTLIQGNGRLRIGDGVILNSGVHIDCWESVTIGDRAIVGVDTMIADSDMHGVAGAPARVLPVKIGAGTWIGARCTVMPGVSVGSRCVVGAGSLVTKNIPDETVWAGNPAKQIRTLELPEGQVTAWN